MEHYRGGLAKAFWSVWENDRSGCYERSCVRETARFRVCHLRGRGRSRQSMRGEARAARQTNAKRSVPPQQQPRSKKVFVGGLAPATKEEDFREYFERFGPVLEAQIMIDHHSGRSRGFGFVTFERESSVEQVFQVGTMHELSGKRVEVKSATPRGSGPVTGRGMVGDRRMMSQGPPMGGRGMGMMPGQMSPQYGMNPYNAVGYNPSMMGPYGMGPFNPTPYAYNNAMMAQMNQMQQMGGFGYGGYQNPYGGAGFNPQAAGMIRPQQGQNLNPEGFEQQQPLGEGYPQTSPGPRFPNFPGRGQQR
ncbi:hypothetical protein ABBQ32_002613 [Trebouxia sp. C0010 RCD-2024]